jgi:hypothetical protein
LALSIVEDLRNDRDISSGIVLEYFDLRRRQDQPSLWNRIRRIFRAKDVG